MKIGLTFTVRAADRANGSASAGAGGAWAALDDEQEEFDSPETIAAVAAALAGLGHEVELLGDGEPLVRRLLDGPRPDLVWNFAEGTGALRAREARVPALLELLDIPYTGSDPLTLAAALDKDCAKRIVASHDVATPAWELVSPETIASGAWQTRLRFPLFVKPALEGSSKGIVEASIVGDARQLECALAGLAEVYRQSVLVEEFIDGEELTVGLVGNGRPDILGVMRITPRRPDGEPFVYSLKMKREFQQHLDYECPARLAARDTEAVCTAALAVWQALGCRDVARIDFRLRDGVPYFLEANPLPGLSPVSGDLVLLIGLLGIEYRELVGRILNAACDRLGLPIAEQVER